MLMQTLRIKLDVNYIIILSESSESSPSHKTVAIWLIFVPFVSVEISANIKVKGREKTVVQSWSDSFQRIL